MVQELYDLPEGWEWSLVGELGEFVRGVTYKKGDLVASMAPNVVTLLRANNIQASLDLSETQLLPQQIVKEEKLLQKGDILFCMSSGSKHLVGKNVLIAEELDNYSFGAFCSVLRLNGDGCSAYLAKYFSSPQYKKALLPLSRGAGINNLKGRDLKLLSIPLPPLNEQKRIVTMLDALFTRIDTAITHLQQTLELSKALFESASAHVFNNGDEWDTVKLSVLLDRGWITSHLDGNHGSNYPRKTEFVNEGVPYISANCLCNGEVMMSLSKFLAPKRASMLRKGIAMNNDVLFAHNATVGPVAILRTDCEKVVLSTSLTYYRCDPKFILPEYLAQYMKAAPFTSQYRAVMSQSTRNQVPITKQREFKFIVPPINKQRWIAAQLDALSERTRTLEASTKEKLNDLTVLKASLLDAAFKGEL